MPRQRSEAAPGRDAARRVAARPDSPARLEDDAGQGARLLTFALTTPSARTQRLGSRVSSSMVAALQQSAGNRATRAALGRATAAQRIAEEPPSAEEEEAPVDEVAPEPVGTSSDGSGGADEPPPAPPAEADGEAAAVLDGIDLDGEDAGDGDSEDADALDLDAEGEEDGEEGEEEESAADFDEGADLDGEDELDEVDAEEELEAAVDSVPPLTIELDGERHEVVVEMVGDEPVAGMHSDWTTLAAIRRDLAGVALAPAVTAAFNAADVANQALGQADHNLGRASARRDRTRREASESRRRAEAARAEMFRGAGAKKPSTKLASTKRPSTKKRAKSEAGQRPAETKAERAATKARFEWSDALREVRAATFELTDATRYAISTAWANHRAHLRLHLMPVGAVFQDQPVAAGLTVTDYHYGTQADPIPIIWYKRPQDYPDITTGAGTVGFPGPVQISGALTLGVAAGNQPPGFELRKVAHDSDRAGQQAINAQINAAQPGIGAVARGTVNPMTAGNFDGDHVRDLGFSGDDVTNNYWPLDATINRRAFNGYNSAYQVHYRVAGIGGAADTIRLRAVGGLIGRYFTVKGYLGGGDGPVPAESGTANAGHA